MEDKANKKELVVITIVLSFIEVIIALRFNYLDILSAYFASKFGISNGLNELIGLLTPAGLFYLVNYYLISPLIYILFRTIWRLSGHYGYLFRDTKPVVERCVNWLISCNVHWGVRREASVCQNANTCEGLTALRKADVHREKHVIYKNAFVDVLNNVDIDGLPSKSLGRATVVCTSMILYLIGLEKRDDTGIITDYITYENLAKVLWNARNDERGWGVYVRKTDSICCSLANTYWALLAISMYDISNTQEYKDYLRMIYEYNSGGKFGFYVGDESRLVTTAMYLSLYYELPDDIKNSINYNSKKAAKFVLNRFVIGKIEVEAETINGINDNQIGPTKAPWNHIVVGYCMEALSKAYAHSDISTIQMDLFISRIFSIMKKSIFTKDSYSYYIPEGLQQINGSIFTYPTAYLINGFCSLSYINLRR